MDRNTQEYIKEILGANELKDVRKLLRQLFAEVTGTFLYLSLILLTNSNFGSNTDVIIIEALANGLLVASVIQITGHTSGGHINPAVTVGAIICGHIRVLKAVLYVAAQILGSLAGSIVAYAFTNRDTRDSLGATLPSPRCTPEEVFGMELVMTFVLVSVVMSVLDQNRDSKGLGSGPLAIGLAITACLCCTLPYTGSMNPVRSFGPAVIMNIWNIHWVYWVAPLLGGLVAGLFHKYVFSTTIKEDSVE